MDESIVNSLKCFQNENGFSIRNKLKKTQLRFLNSFSFTIIAQNEGLSKSLYGMVAPIKNIRFDISHEELKNTNYTSFDYEKYCNKDNDEFKISTNLKKLNASSTSIIKKKETGLSRSARLIKRSLKPCHVSLKLFGVEDILSFKLSKGSMELMGKLTNKKLNFEALTLKPMEKTIPTETDNDIIILSDSEEITKKKESISKSKIVITKVSPQKSPVNNKSMILNIVNENKNPAEETSKNVRIEMKSGMKRSRYLNSISRNHDDLVNDFENRAEVEDEINEKFKSSKITNQEEDNQEFIDSQNNLENISIRSKKFKRSFSKHQFKNPPSTCGKIQTFFENRKMTSKEFLKFSKSPKMNFNGKIRSFLQSEPLKTSNLSISNQIHTPPSSIRYIEFVQKNKKIQFEQNLNVSLILKRKSVLTGNSSPVSQDVDIIDLTI